MSCISTARMISSPGSDATGGMVKWVPAKSLWTGALTLIALILGPLTITPDAFLLFLITSAVTLCAGHSVGMHRLLIHRSFAAPRWLERLLVYLGTLVGMAGPFGMIAAHDIRDWAQRQRECHDLYAHRRSFFIDAWWQMHCAVKLDHPPLFTIEPETHNDPFYRFLERSWMLQQLPWAFLFFAIGGLPWLVWGIAVRVSVSLTGHWLIGHFAHRRGHQGWAVDDVAVQGYNIKYVGLVTFGECWHGNHHAFPGSARLGVEPGQTDPGWWLISILKKLDLARNVKQPQDLAPREGLRRLNSSTANRLLDLGTVLRLLIGCAVSLPIAAVALVMLAPVEYYIRTGASLADLTRFITSYEEHLRTFLATCAVAGVQYVLTAVPLALLIVLAGQKHRFNTIGRFAITGAIVAALPWAVILLPQGLLASLTMILIALSGAVAGGIFGAVILAPSPCRSAGTCA